ncbi:MAG: hypothetical protein GWP05_06095 [Anaerolineaceae bacterium]|nr:hypothetical protein [Anaerolineaceae bacterium]
MRHAIFPFALLLCIVLLAGPALAQEETLPVPPDRVREMGDTVIEKGKKVEAEEPAAEKTPAAEKPADVVAEPATEETPAQAPATTPAETPTEAPAPAAAETPAETTVTVEGQPTEEPPAETSAEAARMKEAREIATKDLETTEVTVAEEKKEEVVPPDVSEITTTPSPERPHEMQVPPAKRVSSLEGEVEMVERLAVARETYRLSLEALKQHYVTTGNATKLLWVTKELDEFNRNEKYHYLSELELSGPDLKPAESIAAADQLYKEAMDFKNYPAFPDEKREKLKIAVQKLRTIIRDYPTSDKIDDASFRLGEIYEGWYYKDYARAAVAFERCFQWNPGTILPARIKAARIYDQKLLQRDKAVILYNLIVAESPITSSQQEAAARLAALSPK